MVDIPYVVGYNGVARAKRIQKSALPYFVYKIGGMVCRTFFNTTPPQKGKSRVSPRLFPFLFAQNLPV